MLFTRHSVRHLSFREIGAELFLSQNTVKSQAITVYRKLAAANRSQAVIRARGLGLLEDEHADFYGPADSAAVDEPRISARLSMRPSSGLPSAALSAGTEPAGCPTGLTGIIPVQNRAAMATSATTSSEVRRAVKRASLFAFSTAAACSAGTFAASS